MSNQNYRDFFEEAMNQLHNEYKSQNLENDFKLWFNLDYVEDTISEITVSVASEFMWKQMQTKGNVKKLEDKILELTGQTIRLNHIVKTKPVEYTNSITETEKPVHIEQSEIKSDSYETKPKISKHPQLKEIYTFENFIPGENSVYPYNAALAAAKNPGEVYNPMLIYGGVGLGKTHLQQAIGNYVYEMKGEKLKLAYIGAEEFMNEFISSINTKTTEKFKKKYRSLDVLLIDDIQFLEGKDQTQEELFHTFNAIYDKKGLLVFTSDRPITELKGITERLRTRFTRGLNVDLKPPTYENKVAIIKKKLEILNKELPAEVIDFIAKNVQTNVRDIESSLIKMISYAEITKKELNVEIAQDQLRDTINNPFSGTITVENIQKVIANHYAISVSDIKSKKRDKKFVIPRQIAIYISRELTEYSYPDLGREFGDRDHTTMMHAYEKVDTQLKTDSSLSSTINLLMREVKDYKK